MSLAGIAFGLSIYNEARYLRLALESILAQRENGFKVVIFDNGSSDGSGQIAADFARNDSRVIYHRSEKNLGMIRGFREAYQMAVSECEGLRYFAWASGHDLWHPEWLEAMRKELDDHPEAVLVYPIAAYIDDDGAPANHREVRFDSAGIVSATRRFRWVCDHLEGAGSMAYGLYRSQMLSDCGVYRDTFLPDRLLMFELSLRGEFRQVCRPLWYRRIRPAEAVMSTTLERQRKTLFEKNQEPSYLAWPWWIVFGSIFFKTYFLKTSFRQLKKRDAFTLSFYLAASQGYNQTRKRVLMSTKRALSALGLREWARRMKRR